MNCAVYLLASQRNGTLYTGVTSNLVQRVWQHRNNLADGFTKKYSVHTLVWFEPHATMESAIVREKAIKVGGLLRVVTPYRPHQFLIYSHATTEANKYVMLHWCLAKNAYS